MTDQTGPTPEHQHEAVHGGNLCIYCGALIEDVPPAGTPESGGSATDKLVAGLNSHGMFPSGYTAPESGDELEQIFNQYDQDATNVPKHWKRTYESKAALEKARAAIEALVGRRETLAEIRGQLLELRHNRRWFEKMAEYADVKQDAMNEYDDRISMLEQQLPGAGGTEGV